MTTVANLIKSIRRGLRQMQRDLEKEHDLQECILCGGPSPFGRGIDPEEISSQPTKQGTPYADPVRQ